MGGCVKCGFSFTKAVLSLAQTTLSPRVSRNSFAEYFALERDQVCRRVTPPDVSLIPTLPLACAVSSRSAWLDS